MTNPSNNDKPKTFGARFKERGLVGALAKKPKGKSDPNKMHFLEHLEEMRWVILKVVVVFLLGCVTVAVFLDESVRLLQRPLISAVHDFGSIAIDLESSGLSHYRNTLEKQGVGLTELVKATEKDLINWGITDPQHRLRFLIHFAGGKDRNLLQVIRSYSPIFIAMKICFLGGLGISLPFMLYFISGFVIPGLTPSEKKIFFPGCIASTLLFVTGAGMTYFFILPLSLAFTIDFSFNVLGLEVYRPEAGNYYSTVIWMTFAVGLAFQFPLVLVLLIRIGLLSVSSLRSSRRVVLVILMISAALITPGGDPVSLCILTIPLYFLYEISILIGTLIEKKREAIESPNPSGFFGSLALLSILLVSGTGLGWLYLNWEKAESFFLQLPSNTSKEHPAKTNPSSDSVDSPDPFFILEILPMSATDGNESNQTFPRKEVYRARILDQGK
jgi:sec-independent protein translocase protein TatC